MTKRIKNIAHHRNGCGGNPFYIVHFYDGNQEMIAVVFEDQEKSVAVFDFKKLDQRVIAFGENSWRGDDYESWLRWAVQQYDAKLLGASNGEETWKVMQGGPKVWGKKAQREAGSHA